MNEKMLSLPPNEAHIWTAFLPSTELPTTTKTLSAHECDRASRFHFAEDRFRYVFAHGVLREVLSRYVRCPPGDIQFATNPFGKPFIEAASGSRPPEFNLSHAGRIILVGVCAGRSVGIDVEEIRPIKELLSIANSQYTPQECAFILAQPSGQLERAFFRVWTRKEAYVKAMGKGLSIQLNSFDTLASGKLSDTVVGSRNTPMLQIADLDVPEGFVASIAVEQGIDRLVHFEYG